MEGQQFTEQGTFWATLEQYADKEISIGYQSIIVEHATIGFEDMSLSSQTMLGNSVSAYLSQTSAENRETWESLCYYPKVFKHEISSQRSKTSTRKTDKSLDKYLTKPKYCHIVKCMSVVSDTL